LTQQWIVSFNITLLLLAGILVVLMQAGFALVVTGLCRAKNAAQVISTNLAIFAFSVLGFWVCGFALMSAVWPGIPAAPGLTGQRWFFLHGTDSQPAVLVRFFFQAALVAVAAVIPAGAMAERWKFASVIPYGFFISAVPLAIFGNWVWGGGWLSRLGTSLGLGQGFVDFAGASVIHMAGGVIGLMGAMALGPRIGKYARDGRPRPMPGHNLVYVTVGTVLLAVGWFGFNLGPAVFTGGERAPLIAVNTLLASVAGAASAYAIVRIKFGKPDPSMVCNGLLAGLVAISASCAFVSPAGAVITGAVAGLLVVYAVLFFEGRMKVDDPMGAVSVHGVGGAWGVVSLGLMADGRSDHEGTVVTGAFATLFGGPKNDWTQLGAQLLGAATCMVFLGVAGWGWFKICGVLAPLRSRHEDELAGLDLPEMGAECYPDFHLTDKGSTRAE
jgi:Amt family ammonium transporter